MVRTAAPYMDFLTREMLLVLGVGCAVRTMGYLYVIELVLSAHSTRLF